LFEQLNASSPAIKRKDLKVEKHSLEVQVLKLAPKGPIKQRTTTVHETSYESTLQSLVLPL